MMPGDDAWRRLAPPGAAWRYLQAGCTADLPPAAPHPPQLSPLPPLLPHPQLLVDRMVKSTEQQLSDSARVLQDILTAAANEQGEWYLPLEPQQVRAAQGPAARSQPMTDLAAVGTLVGAGARAAPSARAPARQPGGRCSPPTPARPPAFAPQVQKVRAALDQHAAQLDEALLSNAFAWIRKCNEDGFDTMVTLIQKVRAGPGLVGDL
jgi:hypothetical protein